MRPSVTLQFVLLFQKNQGDTQAAQGQIKTVVNNVVFPVLDVILAVLFFVKVGASYFDCAPVEVA